MFNAPKDYTEVLKKNILSALEDPKTERIAAFDADGTCWFSDVGRDFFDYQIETGFFPNGKTYSWEDYQKVEDQDITLGLQWLAQILKGFSLNEVREFGKAYQKSVRPDYIAHQKEIIEFLHAQEVEVYIVTASVKWSVEAAAEELGIKPSHIIGVETLVENGKITDQLTGPLTWREGKVEALLEKTNGKMPFFANGNTMSDIFMLREASHIKQVIHSAGKESSIYTGENAALKEAKEKNWHYADFIRNDFKNSKLS